MTKVNLVTHAIDVMQVDFIQAVNSQREFGITLEGDIVYEFEKKPYIFKGKANKPSTATPTASPITQALGKGYTISLNGPKLSIKCSQAWQEILDLNIPHASYDDSSGDGIGEFEHERLEQIGWHATDFDITYREIVDYLEAQVDGVLLCIEREEPYQFSGIGFFANEQSASQKAYDFCVARITDLRQSDDYSDDKLTRDQKKALEFFEVR